MPRPERRKRPVASSSPLSDAQRLHYSHDISSSSGESSEVSSDEETLPCSHSSVVDDISLKLSNNVSLETPRPRRHSSPHRPPLEFAHSRSSSCDDRVRQPPDTNTPVSSLWLVVIFVAIIVLMIAAVFLNSRFTSVSPSARRGLTSLESLKTDLRNAFPSQSNRSWSMFTAELRLLLQSANTNRPGIVMLAGAPNSQTLPCLASRLGGAAAALLGGSTCRTVASGEDLTEADTRKQAMDQEVHGAYLRGERCFQFSRLERFSDAQLLLLHAWCDGDHSPFTKAFLLFVLHAEGELTEDAVERFLLQHWGQKVGPDEAGALNTRLANSVFIVKEEKNLESINCVH